MQLLHFMDKTVLFSEQQKIILILWYEHFSLILIFWLTRHLTYEENVSKIHT